jgi:hypothetical protein
VALPPVDARANGRRDPFRIRAFRPDGLELCAAECYPGLNHAAISVSEALFDRTSVLPAPVRARLPSPGGR